MASIFLLSIHAPHVDRIRSGAKRWEFRRNPRFGAEPGRELARGDRVFLVATAPDPTESVIPCVCLAGRILRGPELEAYFAGGDGQRWREEGGAPETERDRVWFEREILGQYPCALELEPHDLEEPIPVREILRASTGKPWSGRGWLPVRDLHRYRIQGRQVSEVLEEASRLVRGEPLHQRPCFLGGPNALQPSVPGVPSKPAPAREGQTRPALLPAPSGIRAGGHRQ